MGEVEILTTQVYELARENNTVLYEIDNMSQVSYVNTNTGGNNFVGGHNVQVLSKKGPL